MINITEKFIIDDYFILRFLLFTLRIKYKNGCFFCGHISVEYQCQITPALETSFSSMLFMPSHRGFGFIGYPGRIGIGPELTIVELKKA
jgi:hypothetical protein